MIGKISRNLLRTTLLKNQKTFSGFLDKSNFVQGKLEAEVNPPTSQLNKNYYNPEYRYATEDSDIMRLYNEKDNSLAEGTWTDVLDNAYTNVLVFNSLVDQSRVVLPCLVLLFPLRIRA